MPNLNITIINEIFIIIVYKFITIRIILLYQWPEVTIIIRVNKKKNFKWSMVWLQLTISFYILLFSMFSIQ